MYVIDTLEHGKFSDDLVEVNSIVEGIKIAKDLSEKSQCAMGIYEYNTIELMIIVCFGDIFYSKHSDYLKRLERLSEILNTLICYGIKNWTSYGSKEK